MGSSLRRLLLRNKLKLRSLLYCIVRVKGLAKNILTIERFHSHDQWPYIGLIKIKLKVDVGKQLSYEPLFIRSLWCYFHISFPYLAHVNQAWHAIRVIFSLFSECCKCKGDILFWVNLAP